MMMGDEKTIEYREHISQVGLEFIAKTEFALKNRACF